MKKKKPTPKPVARDEAPAYRPFEALRGKLDKKPEPARPAPPPPPAPRPAPPRAGPDDARERELFRVYMSGTVPLGAKPGRVPKTASELERPAPSRVSAGPAVDPDAEARARLRALVEGTATFEVNDDGDRIEGRRADSDPRQLRRLRRGEWNVDATLDLHGLSAEEARRSVESFVASKRASRERTVLIVHGKGGHSPRGYGVLRGEIGAWLSEGPAATHVLCFTSALPADGGAGALYVLLRP